MAEKNSGKKKTTKKRVVKAQPENAKTKTAKKSDVKKTKAAIVGTASTTAHLAPNPQENPEFFICGLAWRKSAPNADRVYEMHRLQTGHVSTPPNYIKFLNEVIQKGTEVYAYDYIPGVDGIKVFPLKEIVSWLAKKTQTTEEEATYFMSTLSYELVHLMYEGWKEIHIYGVDLSTQREYCIDPKTKILTKDLDWIEAKDAKVGDELVGFDEDPINHDDNKSKTSYRKWATSVIEDVQNLNRPCYKIRLDDGTEVISSAEHRWLVSYHYDSGTKGGHWIRTDEIARKDGKFNTKRPMKMLKAFNVWEKEDSWEAGYLAAAFDGEGCLYQQNKNGNTYGLSITFAQNDNMMSREVVKLLDKFGINFLKKKPSGGTKCYEYQINGDFSERLEFLGKLNPKRLLDKFNLDLPRRFQATSYPTIESIEYVGNRDVVGIKTSTGTFIAEGLASHNSHQKPNFEYLIGLARGMGIKVYFPEGSSLVKATHLYGYERAPGEGAITVGDLKKKKKAYEQEHQEAQARFYTLDGARQELDAQINFLEQLQKGINPGNYSDPIGPKQKK